MRPSFTVALAFAILLFANGCRQSGSFNMSRNPAWNAAKASARQELAQLPPPTRSKYFAVNQSSQWQNPFLTVESNMVQIRIYLEDENSSAVDRGGMTRLSSARKHILNVRFKDLPRALAALPNGAWPYGRVVAIGEQAETSQNRTLLRGNLAATISALQDMGITVENWTDRTR